MSTKNFGRTLQGKTYQRKTQKLEEEKLQQQRCVNRGKGGDRAKEAHCRKTGFVKKRERPNRERPGRGEPMEVKGGE